MHGHFYAMEYDNDATIGWHIAFYLQVNLF